MGVVLAGMWKSPGNVGCLRSLLPRLQEAYGGIALALPSEADPEEMLSLQDLLGLTIIVPLDWAHRRHAALQKALELPGSHIHLISMEQLLPWMERFPEEWSRVLEAIRQSDCLIIGRSKQAWATYPLAIQETERSVNNIFSALLGRKVDLGSGSRGLSRPAAMFLLAYSPPRHVPEDAAWPVLLHRAGFAIDHLAVDGLQWEAEGHTAPTPDEANRRRAVEEFDRDIGNWLRRARSALEVIQAGLEASRREVIQGAPYWREVAGSG